MLSISVKDDGKFKFIIAEGESMEGPIPPTGNTNTHGKFAPDVRTFLKRWAAEGPTHHFALGIGHHAETYAFRLAQKKNWQLINLGIGGRSSNPNDGTILGKMECDFLIVLIGVNDWQSDKAISFRYCF